MSVTTVFARYRPAKIELHQISNTMTKKRAVKPESLKNLQDSSAPDKPSKAGELRKMGIAFRSDQIERLEELKRSGKGSCGYHVRKALDAYLDNLETD